MEREPNTFEDYSLDITLVDIEAIDHARERIPNLVVLNTILEAADLEIETMQDRLDGIVATKPQKSSAEDLKAYLHDEYLARMEVHKLRFQKAFYASKYYTEAYGDFVTRFERDFSGYTEETLVEFGFDQTRDFLIEVGEHDCGYIRDEAV